MRCVILDDEPFAHQVLEHYINETPGLVLVSKFRNSIEAFEYLSKNPVDLLFLDIEMPLINGISFLKALPNKPATIFTTAYKQYAFEGFELDAADYLLKPFSYERFEKAIAKTGLLNQKAGSLDTLVIKDKQSLLNLKQQDILYVEGLKDYVKIVNSAKTHVVYHTLKGILDKLDPVLFIQAHRSYIVNKTHVNRITAEILVLSDDSFIPIGKLYRKGLMEKMRG